jgi:hypothetical protein
VLLVIDVLVQPAMVEASLHSSAFLVTLGDVRFLDGELVEVAIDLEAATEVSVASVDEHALALTALEVVPVSRLDDVPAVVAVDAVE